MTNSSKVIPVDSTDSSKESHVAVPSTNPIRITWKQLLINYSSKRERVQLCLGLICSFLTGFLIPISYIFLGDIVNENNVENMSLNRVGTILIYFVSNLLVTSLFAFYERKNLNGYAENITRRFRETYIRSVLHHDVNYIESMKPGRIGQILSEESSRIINGLGPSVGQLVRAIATFMSGCIIGFLYSWELTIVTLCSAPFVVAAGFYFSKAMGQWIETLMRDHKNADTIIEESIRNVKTVASLGVESQFTQKYTHLIEECRKLLVKALSKAGNWQFVMNFLNDIAITLVFLFATLILSRQRSDFPSRLIVEQCIPDGTDSVSICFGDISSLSANCQAICSAVNNCWFHSRNGQCLVGGDILIVLCGVMNSFVGVGVAFSAIPAIQKTISSASCFLDVMNHKDIEKEDGEKPATAEGDIQFKDVSYEYQSRDLSVLKNLNLTIREGEILGIVGESGSGKSTILKLLLRLYSPKEGTIEWNGMDITKLDPFWIREHISYVAQEPVLFSGTIRENLKYGRPECSDEEMMNAAKLVEADSFIKTFPNGYDTFVGELGNALSGGQKQRIAIARALLRNPKVLILDEATSALDSQSEEIVQKAINKLRETGHKDMTVIIVAHRMSSITNCDRIAVMKEGQVVEEGTHESLLNAGGIYAGLYEIQKQSVQELEVSENTAIVEENRDETQKSKEESKDESITYSFKNIYTFFGKMKPIFWLALLGDFFVGLYPPLYGIIVGYMHAIPFYDSIAKIVSMGFLFSLFMGILSLLHSGGNWLWWNMGNKVKEYMIVQLRRLCYSKLMDLPAAYFDNPDHSSSRITSELSLDIRKLRDFMDEIGAFIECFFILLVGLFISFFPNVGSWQLTLICLIGAPLLFIAEYLNNKLIAGVIEKIDNNLSQSSSHLTDCILNIHTVHAYNLEQIIEDRINKELEVTNQLGSSRTMRHAISNVLSILCPTTFMIIAFGFGSILVYYSQINFLQMYVTYNTVFLFASYTGIALGKVPNMVLAKQAAKRVFSLLNIKNENDAFRSKQRNSVEGDISFVDVSFSYPSRQDQPILNGVSFSIKKGSSVAIVGPSGCGKSTIMSLIQRIYNCDAGTILLNGVDIKEIHLDSYRSRIGAVNQEPFMFSGTIRENLTMGAKRDVRMEELEDLCNQMMCMDFINEMPDRFETDLGPTGKAVSGGQKQRLALVRALLRNPSLLILDEATSALDSENQGKVLDALKKWRLTHECTVITVAHRLSTVVDSDSIIVMNEGKVIAIGTHEELLRDCAFYSSLVRNQ